MLYQKSFHNDQETVSPIPPKPYKIISSSTVNERMFRAKPYTQCMQCIKDNTRLRCQMCMQLIIDDISADYMSSKSMKNKRLIKKQFRIRTNQMVISNSHSQMLSSFSVNKPSFKSRQKDTSNCFKASNNLRLISKTNNKYNIGANFTEKQQIRAQTSGSPQQKLMITSKYKQWLQQKQLNHQNSPNLKNKTTYWPRKTINHDYNLERYGVKQPKFQKWEKKLLDQLMTKTKQIR